MDPASKNWFSLFIEDIRKGLKEDSERIKVCLNEHKTLSDFGHWYLHASGLFYGEICRTKFRLFRGVDSWEGSDFFKIAIIEGLFLSYLFSQKERFLKSSDCDSDILVEECIQKIYDFYVLFTTKDIQYSKFRAIYKKSKNSENTIEHIIDERVSCPSMLELTFWKGSQFNIFAGLDVLYFSLWLQGEYAYDRREMLKKKILSMLIKATNIEKRTNKTGQAIVTYFLTSGDFPSELDGNEKTLITIDFDECNKNDSYVIRLLLYEYAAFSCLSINNCLTQKEIYFLKNISSQLHLSETDAQQSLVLINSFLFQIENKIFYFQSGEGFNMIKKALLNRTFAFLQKNKVKMIKEISESKELLMLLAKSRNEDLSEEEKDKVRTQILDIVKTIPSLAIFMIPGGAILLPILYKIIPEELLKPSSFMNKK